MPSTTFSCHAGTRSATSTSAVDRPVEESCLTCGAPSLGQQQALHHNPGARQMRQISLLKSKLCCAGGRTMALGASSGR